MRAQRGGGVRMVSTRRGRARSRELGQNFLVDRNILDVIERLAALESGDVVLEIGGGPGVLSERLAPRARTCTWSRSIGVSSRCCATSRCGFRTCRCMFADALELDLTALRPGAGKVVANLPYGIAATVILRTIDELPSVCELGRDGPARGRRAARGRPGHAGLRRPVGARPARVRGPGPARRRAHRVPAGAERRLGADRAAARSARARSRLSARSSTRRSRTGARRCAGSLALAPDARPASASGRERRWSRSGTRPTSARSGSRRRSSRELARRLAAVRLTRARTGQGQPVPVPRPRPSRRPPRARDAVRVGVAGGQLTLTTAESGAPDEVVCPGVAGAEPRVGRAAVACAAVGWDAPPRPDRDRQADPGRGRDGRRLGRRRRGAAAGDGAGPRAARGGRRRWRPSLGADVPSQLAPGLVLGTGAGDIVEPLRAAGAARVRDRAELTMRAARPPTSTARPTGWPCRAAPRSSNSHYGALVRSCGPARVSRRSCSSTICSPRRCRCARRSRMRSRRRGVRSRPSARVRLRTDRRRYLLGSGRRAPRAPLRPPRWPSVSPAPRPRTRSASSSECRCLRRAGRL